MKRIHLPDIHINAPEISPQAKMWIIGLTLIGFITYFGIINPYIIKPMKEANQQFLATQATETTVTQLPPTQSLQVICGTLEPGQTMYDLVERRLNPPEDWNLTITIYTKYGPFAYPSDPDSWIADGEQAARALLPDLPEGKSVFTMAQPGSQACMSNP